MSNQFGPLDVAGLEHLSSDPVDFVFKGRVYYNTGSNVCKYYNGSTWISFVDETTAQTLSSKTLTSPVINTGVSGSAIVDEDNMVSDSATKVPTQQSVKAYVDAEILTIASASDSISDRFNMSLAASVGSSALTVSLKTKAGSDPSGGSQVRISYRNSTLTDGTYSSVASSSALSVVVPSTATLGHLSGVAKYIYVYGINNAGATELAVSSSPRDENILHSTTAIDTASDSLTGFYSTSARTNVAVRLLGRMLSTQTTAGTWAAVPTEISTNNIPLAPNAQCVFLTGNGHGSTANRIRLFSSLTQTGTGITGVNDAVNGSSATINEDGIYAMTYMDRSGSDNTFHGISRNAVTLSGAAGDITAAAATIHTIQLAYVVNMGATVGVSLCTYGGIRLSAGDVIRPHTDNNMNATTQARFVITQLFKF